MWVSGSRVGEFWVFWEVISYKLLIMSDEFDDMGFERLESRRVFGFPDVGFGLSEICSEIHH